MNSPNITVFSGPCSEGLKLTLRLTHPSIEKVELSQSCRSSLRIAIHRVESGYREETFYLLIIALNTDPLVESR